MQIPLRNCVDIVALTTGASRLLRCPGCRRAITKVSITAHNSLTAVLRGQALQLSVEKAKVEGVVDDQLGAADKVNKIYGHLGEQGLSVKLTG